MPIVDITIVAAAERSPPGDLAQRLADALGTALQSPPGRLWVRLHWLDERHYAENGARDAEDERPVFVTLLQAAAPAGPALQAQAAALSAAVGGATGRPPGRVHVEFAPPGAGRLAFGGTLSGQSAPGAASTPIPTLETPRLRLVPPSAACFAAYERFYTDADASRAYGGPLTAGAAWARLAADLGSWPLQGFGVWALQSREDGSIVGTCGFWQGLHWPRELTWWLLPQARGRGLAAEASAAAVRHAYEALGWDRVETYMNDDNAPARALVLRLGGRMIDRRAFPDGLQRDVFLVPPPAGARARAC